MRLIDLHTHTDYSDGELPPAGVVRLAAEAGLAAVAITDHDTLDGLGEALAAGRELGIEVVPGVEVSALHAGREMHVLGLWVRLEDAGPLRAALEGMLAGREHRNRTMIGKLQQLGMPICYQQVLDMAQGVVGRPHMAEVLVRSGKVKSYDAAFKRYLGRHGAAYAPKPGLELRVAADAMRAAGATVALAHPYLLGLNGKPMEELARNCRDLGVDSLEAYYTDHSQQRTREYVELARRLEMGVCGGSDFHGKAKPLIRLGVGKGSLGVPETVLDDLKARRAAQGLWL